MATFRTAHTGVRSRPWLAALIVLVAGSVVLLSPGRAWAGDWVQISCENPNGTSASSDGWVGTQTGELTFPAQTTTDCNASTPMEAVIPTSTSAPDNSSETLTYTPPAGSTLTGGQINVRLSADGYGSLPQPASSGVAQVLSPSFVGTDALESCAAWWDGCFVGTSNPNGGGEPADFSGTVALPSGAGGTITVNALCAAYSGAPPCDKGGSNGVWVGVWVNSSDALLDADVTPSGSGFTGTLLSSEASGVADVAFTAAETAGPGIYNVAATVDGKTVYSATPDTNNGECISQGTYTGTSAMEFDDAQPCPLTTAVDIPVDTSRLKNGKHALDVTVTDAAGNTATVESTYFTVDNSVSTPLPKASKSSPRVRVQLTGRWQPYDNGLETGLLGLHSSRLPAGASMRIRDTGPHHPRLTLTQAADVAIPRLLRALSRDRFTTGDTLTILISAPGRRTEVIELTFKDGHKPAVTVG